MSVSDVALALDERVVVVSELAWRRVVPIAPWLSSKLLLVSVNRPMIGWVARDGCENDSQLHGERQGTGSVGNNAWWQSFDFGLGEWLHQR